MISTNHSWVPTGDNALVFKYIDSGNSEQTDSVKEAIKILGRHDDTDKTIDILDLGCGDGNSFEKLQTSTKKLRWTGIDIDDSPEVSTRSRDDLTFLTFDGLHIPLPDNSIDIIYSHQVLEHVRYPQQLLSDTFRVLKGGGYLVGSTSQLEPFHSRSYWNFTPYGCITLLETAGFSEIVVKPGMDGFTLLLISILRSPQRTEKLMQLFSRESILNFGIEAMCKLLNLGVERSCLLKLRFSGHFVFIARKQNN